MQPSADSNDDGETVHKTVVNDSYNQQGQDVETDDSARESTSGAHEVGNENTQEESSGSGDCECECRDFVHSELLCFTQNYMQSCAPDNIKRIVQCFYSAEQIREAKQTLWNCKIGKNLKKFQNRKSTPNRSETEANLNDIMEALSDLDRQNIECVKFIAIDLTQIPKHTPEEMNQYAILERIAALERKYEDLQGNCSRNYIMVTNQEKSIEKIKEESATNQALLHEVQENMEKKSGTHPCSDGQGDMTDPSEHDDDDEGDDDDDDENGNEDIQPDSTPDPTDGETSAEETAVVSSGADDREESPVVSTTPLNRVNRVTEQNNRMPAPPSSTATRQVGAQVNRPTSASHGGSLGIRSRPQQFSRPGRDRMQHGQRNEYQTQNSQREYGRRQTRPDGRPTYAGMVSQNRKSTEEFQIPAYHRKRQLQHEKNRDLFITKIDKQFTCDQLYDYLRNNGVAVKGLFQRSHMNSSYKSFVVTVQNNEVNKVKNGRLWDDGIQIREYVPKV